MRRFYRKVEDQKEEKKEDKKPEANEIRVRRAGRL